ncbi:MAG: NADH-quinone oxidoreductase subunit L [Burkholderiales bacterium]|nr:NADH-quinone oxidoreductase subunit L [Burkholderiales bacterium]
MALALTAIVLLPLFGFLVNGLAGNRLGHRFVSVVGCSLPIATFALAILLFAELSVRGGAPQVATLYTWAAIAGSGFDVALYLDPLSAVMTLVVTGVGSLIHVYSIGYMKEDKSYARYFAYLNLFLFLMLLLVLARSLLVLFVGWEGVGLASYLLIGFWFDDPDKARAGKKAFVTNRIGDAGFLLGMFALYFAVGTLDMDRINAAFAAGPPPAVPASLIGILLFIGATGKSAQIPLHVWLPDAMAGPTPVSALIHAATMVTAGVYLVARMSGVYMHAETASQVITVVGAATAFFAATVAIAQHDIKRVLAYSTISQLGFMFVALGVGAYGVAIFHVMTHAFFKACLFLGAGSVIHALGGEQDVRKMGGLARRIPVTFVTFAVATAAIAGIPPLAGFFSKDEILWYAFASDHGGSVLLWAVGAATALLTAFYMFRLLWLTFLGRSRMTPEVEHHVHESATSMTGVLVVLAVASAAGGFVAVPHYLEPLLPLPPVAEHLQQFEAPLLWLSVVIAFAGLALAAWFFGGDARRAERFGARIAALSRVLANKYYVDEFYERVLGRPLTWISDAVFLRLSDRVLLDGSLDGMVRLARRTAAAFCVVQSGNLHRYLFLVLAGSAMLLTWSLGRG